MSKIPVSIATTAKEYSTLPEAIPRNPAHEGLQAIPQETEKISVQPITEQYLYTDGGFRPVVLDDAQPEMQYRTQKQHRICGIRPWLFYTLTAIAMVVVIAAAVAGGVVGSQTHSSTTAQTTTAQASTQSQSSTLTTSSPTSTVSSSVSSPSAVSVTTSALPGPSGVTLLRDCPSSNQTIYPFGGSSDPMLFRKYCNICAYNANNIDNSLKQITNSLDECIDLCASFNIQNQTQIQAGDVRVCNSVCWRWDITDAQVGLCFGYTTRNLSGTFSLDYNSNSDAAVWINESF